MHQYLIVAALCISPIAASAAPAAGHPVQMGVGAPAASHPTAASHGAVGNRGISGQMSRGVSRPAIGVGISNCTAGTHLQNGLPVPC
jgi:hypothetical protein